MLRLLERGRHLFGRVGIGVGYSCTVGVLVPGTDIDHFSSKKLNFDFERPLKSASAPNDHSAKENE
jgi:hypothetical protein